MSFYYFSIENDSSLIPSQIQNQFDYPNDPYIMNISYLTTNFGYGYTFVGKKHFYISNTLLIGVGVSEVNAFYQTEKSSSDKNQPTLQLLNRFGAGYDTGNWYIGICSIYNDYLILDKSNFSLEFDRVDFKIFLGKRFDYKKIFSSLKFKN